MEKEEAGMVILQSNEFHMLFRIVRKHTEDTEYALQVVKCLNKEDNILSEIELKDEELMTQPKSKEKAISLKIKGQADFILVKQEEEVTILEDVDIYEMSTEIAGGFVGNTLGVYASSCSIKSNNYIDILKFIIKY